jgi:hypothetical protein
MSDLSNITLNEIENTIMVVLVGNDSTVFTQYQLFDKVIDKLEIKTNSIHNSFKSKFLIVLRNLMSSYDDVKIYRENNIYKAIYATDNITIKNYNSDFPDHHYDQADPFTINELNSYIIDNDMFQEFTYIDQSSGNTIYHDIVSNNNYLQIKKLIDTNKFNYNIKNLNDKTPLDYINDQRVSNLMIKTLFNKIDILEKELDAFKKQDISVYINELTLLQLAKIKLNKFYDRYKIQIFVVVIGMGCIYYVSQA